jgi:hypothetical protein
MLMEKHRNLFASRGGKAKGYNNSVTEKSLVIFINTS